MTTAEEVRQEWKRLAQRWPIETGAVVFLSYLDLAHIGSVVFAISERAFSRNARAMRVL